MKILVADDDAISRKVLKALLHKRGHEVVCVGNGAAALYAIQHEALDCVLLDIKMPLLSGYEVIREVRSQNWSKRNLPIIAITALAMKGDRDDIIRIGASAYLSKPYYLEEVLAAIESVTQPLCGHSAHQQFEQKGRQA